MDFLSFNVSQSASYHYPDVISMQIISKAVFIHSLEPILVLQATHNKIVYQTQSQLIVYSFTLANENALNILAKEIITFQLGHSDLIAILLHNKKVQLRLLDDIQKVTTEFEYIISSPTNPRLILNGEYVYLLQHNSLQRFSTNQQYHSNLNIFLEEGQPAKNLMLSQLFQPDPLFIVQYDTVITFSINSSMMASLKFDQLRQTMLLYDPLAEGYSEEYLLVLTHLQLKVYHMASLKQIFQLDIVVATGNVVELCCDPFNEYVLVREKDCRNKTLGNRLLRVQKTYFKYDSKKHSGSQNNLTQIPFFTFYIELSLLQNLHFFPKRQEMITKQPWQIIDLCYHSKQVVTLASLMIKNGLTNKIPRSRLKHPDWREIPYWRQLISDAVDARQECILIEKSKQEEEKRAKEENQQEKKTAKKNMKKKSIQQVEKESEKQWQLFLKQFLNRNYPSQPVSFSESNVSASNSKQTNPKTNILNYEQQILRLLQKQLSQPLFSYPLLKESIKPQQKDFTDQVQAPAEQQDLTHCENQEEKYSSASSSVDNDAFLKPISSVIEQGFQEINTMIDSLTANTLRIQQLHMNKLNRIKWNVKSIIKETQDLKLVIERSCADSMSKITQQLRSTLVHFQDHIDVIETTRAKNWQRVRKQFKDQLIETIEVQTQKLEQSQNGVKSLQQLVNQLGE